MTNDNLDIRIKEYFDILDQIAELQSIAESIKDEVKSAMVESESEELEGSGWRATWHNTTTCRLDQKALKAQYPDVYSSFTKESKSTRFTLNKVHS